jgi:hypothetical protein
MPQNFVKKFFGGDNHSVAAEPRRLDAPAAPAPEPKFPLPKTALSTRYCQPGVYSAVLVI